MTHGQLFAGIGGFGLAAQWAGVENVWANEIDSFCCKILKKNFKELKIYEQDIREIGKHNLESVDIITGGFPCQPFSHAGKRKGKEDDRYLWPENFRIIQELNPQWFIGENVAGLISMENGKILERILIDLEDSGYYTETFLIPACSVGAWHRRDRIWIIANNERIRRSKRSYPEECNRTQIQDRGLCGDVSNTNRQGLQRRERNGMEFREQQTISRQRDSPFRGDRYWEFEPNMGRVANGIPQRVDRLKGLGNAIVPQVAYEIFKAINETANNQ